MTIQSLNLSPSSIELISRFDEDCKLRGFGSAMDYVYQVREFCSFLETMGKTPMSTDKDDIKSFLVHLKERGINSKRSIVSLLVLAHSMVS